MIRPGLQRITRLMADTPTPWKAIHVAGTNGKGSVCNAVSAMLNVYNDSDWRKKTGQPSLGVGQFTSPHLLHRWDGITIHGQPIAEDKFKRIEQFVQARNKDLAIDASEFEQLTAAAFTSFTESRVDIAVVEAGMGGLDDATNIIGQDVDVSFPNTFTLSDGQQIESRDMRDFRPRPLVAAITNVGRDHTEFLGSKIGEIAAHKAGIIKPDAWVVAAAGAHPAYRAIWKPVPQHVFRNTSVALRSVWAALTSLNLIPDKDSPELGFLEHNFLWNMYDEMLMAPLKITMPGRQEMISLAPISGSDRPVLLDGAHNLESAKILSAAVEALPDRGRRPPKYKDSPPVQWIFGCSSTKDVSEILKALRIRGADTVHAVEFATPVDGMPWVKPTPAAEVAAAVREQLGDQINIVEWGADVAGALRASGDENIPDRHKLVIAGSLYLVGDVKRLLKEAAEDPEG
ncbi:FolC bifunctional protein, partial [Dissoconium aciculare CBS 342.82]|uniref:FolC bifunctional protein n=1 Tax=Dissoconium aciculare CBS 342.82 TaxID=1314786 RepID=A0A6J3LWS4_9PEZI